MDTVLNYIVIMIREIKDEAIFKMFLNAISKPQNIKKVFSGIISEDHLFQYFSLKKTISYKMQTASYSQGEYEMNENVFLYRVIQSDGNIYVRDENDRNVLVLTSDKDILKIEEKIYKDRQTILSEKSFDTVHNKCINIATQIERAYQPSLFE
jgi:hypothetical protein